MVQEQNEINRHELISHFYSEKVLNEQGKGVLEALQFSSFQEALQWLVNEFKRVNLDWHKLDAGSPYAVSLPNVIRYIEEQTHKKIEEEIEVLWNDLSEEEKTTITNNFKKIFGSPELVQHKNTLYCSEKYKSWISIIHNG